MKFNMPTASRKRLEELLEYLGKTENYSKYYEGNRAEDFKKCVDIESPWCWKYADIVLRGLEKRKLGYSEGHHAVPRAFYGVKYNCHRVDDGNWFTLSYAEHVWAHYCLVWCATGKMQGKMISALLTMYRIGIRKKRPLMPSETELLNAIPELEIKRIQSMEPRWAKVEVEGRTHYSEDPEQYKKDYREANKEKLAEQKKAYYGANKEKIAEQKKVWREANKEQLDEYKKIYYEENKDKILEQRKAYAKENKEKIAEQKKAYRKANKEQLDEYKKTYYEENKDKILEQHKAYYEENKEQLSEYKKAWCEAHKEQLAEYKKAWQKANKEKIAERKKAYRKANKEKIAEYKKAWDEAKKAAGYRRCKNPLTGKREWVFVGLPESPKSAKVA